MVPGTGKGENAFEVEPSIEFGRCQGSRPHFQIWNGMGRGELHAARDSRTLRKASDDAAHILCTEILCPQIDRTQVFPQGNITACGFETTVDRRFRFLLRLLSGGWTPKSTQQKEANEI